MKFITKILLAVVIGILCASQLMQMGIVSVLKEDLEALGKEGSRYLIYFNRRIKDLEEAYATPAYGEVESQDATPTQDTQVSQDTKPQEVTTTLPEDVAHEAETMAGVAVVETEAWQDSEEALPSEAETSEAQGYVITVYQGVIGIFDTQGHLVDTCNIYVMTLPTKDREMLTAGIEADGWQEVEEILDRLG